MSAGPEPVADSSTGLSPRAAAALAYAGWWVTGGIMWFVERRDPYVRFHAAQSVIAFGACAVLIAGLGAAAFASLLVRPDAAAVLMWLLGLVWLGTLVVWATSMWRAARGRPWRIPLASSLADRLVT